MSRPAPRVTIILAALALLMTALVATPASADALCVADDAADVDDNNTAPPEIERLDVPKSDILAFCADYTETHLEMTLRLAEPSDPATDPDWEGQRTAIGIAVDLDGRLSEEDGTNDVPGGEELTINVARFLTDGEGNFGPPEIRVFTADTNVVTNNGACIYPAVFDGIRYRIRVPVACLDHPDETHTQADEGEEVPEPEAPPAEIRLAPFIFYNSVSADPESAGYFDEMPDFPAYLPAVTPADSPATEVDRLAGPSRVETAIEVSQDDFTEGTAQSVVLARADASPDALAGAPLAVATGGPLLLTSRDALPSAVLAEIQRVLPDDGTIYLSGGTAAIAEAVETDLTDRGYDVRRAAGATRYATAVEVARAANASPELIVVADGNDFPDALVGGALAGAEGGVQILSNGNQLDDTASAYLAEFPDAEVLAVGANAAAAVPSATALTGDTPFATSVVVAERFNDPSGVAIASGTNFPDGLSGGAHAGRAGIPLLLSWPDVVPTVVADYLAGVAPIGRVAMYGGTAALSYQIEADAARAIG